MAEKKDQRKGQDAATPAEQNDATLFREAMKDVRRLVSPPFHIFKTRPRPIPQNFIRDEEQALQDSLSDHYIPLSERETGEEMLYLRDGQSPDLLTKLRRGKWVVQAHLDLHGLISSEARLEVAQFIHDCKRRKVRCVRIVHGKGLGSRNKEPVLKNKLRGWLMQKDEVLAYAEAKKQDGGSGAVVVLLKV